MKCSEIPLCQPNKKTIGLWQLDELPSAKCPAKISESSGTNLNLRFRVVTVNSTHNRPPPHPPTPPPPPPQRLLPVTVAKCPIVTSDKSGSPPLPAAKEILKLSPYLTIFRHLPCRADWLDVRKVVLILECYKPEHVDNYSWQLFNWMAVLRRWIMSYRYTWCTVTVPFSRQMHVTVIAVHVQYTACPTLVSVIYYELSPRSTWFLWLRPVTSLLTSRWMRVWAWTPYNGREHGGQTSSLPSLPVFTLWSFWFC